MIMYVHVTCLLVMTICSSGSEDGSEDGVYNETSHAITRFLKCKGLEKTVLDPPNEARVPQKGHQCFESFCGNLGV